MLTLEQEIIQKFHQLRPASQRRVLDALTREWLASFDFASWQAEVEAAQLTLTAEPISGSDWVREVREERDDELLYRFGFGSLSSHSPN